MQDLRIKRQSTPLYLQVARHLEEEIMNGAFQGEERLPSEEKLSKMLGVSRATVREALSILEEQGHLKRIHGVGTIITPIKKIPIGQGMERLESYTEYLQRYGHVPGTKERDFQWIPARRRHRKDFDRPLDCLGLITRVRTADEQPLMYSEDLIPQEVLGEDFTLETMGESLFEYIKGLGITLAYSEMTIAPIVADADLANHLEVAQGVPLLAIEERYFDRQGQVVLWSRNVYRADRWVFKIFRSNQV
ncbi:MAG: GntR family transcriptional regulator [Firmicutes bacterium]|nr:GntR family transcriptional regulator [Bacillota bacterium]